MKFCYIVSEVEAPMFYTNYDLENVISPVNIDQFNKMLTKTNYPKAEREFLIDGFHNGFDLGFRGDFRVKRRSPNLKIRVGNETILWNKIMKEVKNLRYAGPYEEIPYKYFMQSLVGLVPKDNGKDTRLIFHLSYHRNGISINSETPKHLTTVSYCDFTDTVRICLKVGRFCKLAKSDMKSAFRNLGISKKFWPLLILMARNLVDRKMYYFIDKCLPFGAAISCAHFQCFLNAVAHILHSRTGYKSPNYLDDFLFIAFLTETCNGLVKEFLAICEAINFPVSMEKSCWGTTILTFLGMLLNSETQTVSVPADKIAKALMLIVDIMSHRKTTVKKLQKLMGFINFLCSYVHT